MHPNRSARALLLLLVLAACSKSNNPAPSNGSFSATVGGTAFTANQTAGAYIPSTGQLFVIGYLIQSKDTTGLQVEMPYLPAVDHPISTDTTIAALTYVAGGKRYDAYFGLYASRAVINLTTADTVRHNLAGTFSGTVYSDANANDSLVITNGKFSSSYSIE